MTPLEQTLRESLVFKLESAIEHEDRLLQLCERHNNTFVSTRNSKPNLAANQIVLGLFTKLNIEASSLLSQHSEQIQNMQQTFKQHLGEEHVSRFQLEQVTELTLITHIWLYTQGLLGMDYSLANDHAQQCSALIARFTTQDQEALRTHFNKSYYLGIRQYESSRPKRSIVLRLFEKWFN